jgi:anti-anti-sigma regulatory factor
MAQRARPQTAPPAAPEDIATLTLPPVSDAGAAHALKESLLPLVQKGAPIRLLGGGEVERITTPCMQVLIAADRALAPQQARLVLEAASAPMRLAFGEMGLSDELDRWTAAHG